MKAERSGRTPRKHTENVALLSLRGEFKDEMEKQLPQRTGRDSGLLPDTFPSTPALNT